MLMSSAVRIVPLTDRYAESKGDGEREDVVTGTGNNWVLPEVGSEAERYLPVMAMAIKLFM
jgi:hypothetical protein